MAQAATVDKIRDALVEERQKLRDRLEEQQPVEDGKSVHNLQRNESGMDVAAQQAKLRSERLGRIDQTEDRLEKVKDALQRIDQGEFGTCEVCGDAIDEDRLVSLPVVQRCLDCADQGDG